MSGRDNRGRFTPGNQIAKLGWLGRVNKCFGGDLACARAYIAQLGRWAYAQQAVGHNAPRTMRIRATTHYLHPGAPAVWIALYRKKFEFTLADVPEMEF